MDYAAADTIAALATAPGLAGLAVIRISGSQALAIASAMCPSSREHLESLPGGVFRYRRLRDPATDEFIDEAVVLVFRAPHSYTGEDVVELQLHGGRAVVARVLSVLFSLGARSAEAGEFSRRAFLNGRLAIDQAEAVMDMVAAQSIRQQRAAAELMSGSLGARVNATYDTLLALCADLEATLDFTDEEAEGLMPPENFSERLDAATSALDSLLGTVREGRLLRDGALVVLCGPANAGKSTLFNALLGASRAIVSATPGTTRDSIEETLFLEGIPVRLVDTAGLRQTDSGIEREGQERALALAAQADLLLVLHDPANPVVPVAIQSTPCLHLYTKSDLIAPPEGELSVSAKTGAGLDSLRAAMINALGIAAESATTAQRVSVSERHAALLRSALSALSASREAYTAAPDTNAVPAAAHLRESMEYLGSITGRTYSTDLLDAVFSRFCVGK